MAFSERCFDGESASEPADTLDALCARIADLETSLRNERAMTLTAFRHVRDGGDPGLIGHPNGSEFGDALREMLAAIDASNAELRAALEPFAAGAVINAIERDDYSIMKDRIVDWHGPSDFKAARTAFLATPAASLERIERRVRVKTLEILDEEVKFILSFMPWTSASYARTLRKSGMQIPSKCEEEQAAVMHWMLRLYLEHGPMKWREEGVKILNSIDAEAARIKSGGESGPNA